MSQPYVGEIRMFGGNFAPSGWMFCSGQLLPISENETLFNLIGTTYGGDGQSTFALPDLQGRLPVHMGTLPGGATYQQAQTGGVEQVTLTTLQLPGHQHLAQGSLDSATSRQPAGRLLAEPVKRIYGAPGGTEVVMAPVGSTGGSQPHDNFMPYLCVNFIISLFGVYPSPT